MDTIVDELTELARTVDADPVGVAQRAAELTAAACGHDTPRACRAATLRARALRNLRDVEAAEHAIDGALLLGGAIGGDVLADAHLVAASITTFRRGATDTAHHLDAAERYGSEDVRTQVRIQRAVLLRREGQLDEALDLFDSVVEPLRAGDDTVTLARVVSNRAVILVLRGEANAALSDFAEARRLFQAAGQRFAASIICQNMAWAKVNLGDTASALRLLDQAADELPDLHEVEISRAEAFMAAGLFDDAAVTLTELVDRLDRDGDRAALADASLLLAEAARIAGRPDPDSAESAVAIFDELGLTGRADHARLEALRVSDVDGVVDVDAVEALAHRLADSGHVRSELEAWSLATTRALDVDDFDRAQRNADRCRRRAEAIPFVEHRLAAAHACASVALAAGRVAESLATVGDALDEFAEYRRAIGSPDARSSSERHAGALVALGNRLAAATGCADTVLAWSERRRSSVPIWVRPHDVADGFDDAANDPALNELRSILAELRSSEAGVPPSGRSIEDLFDRRTTLEAELRDRMLRSSVDRSGTPLSDADAEAADDDTVVISLDVLDGELFAVVIDADGAALTQLGPVRRVDRAATAAARMLSSCARNDRSVRDESDGWVRLDAAVAQLEALVLAPLGLPAGPVTLIAPATLQTAPWTMTDTLRTRSVAIAESLSDARLAAAVSTRGSTGSVDVIAGPRLANARREAVAVAAAHDASRVLDGEAATADALSSALANADVVHLAAHTRLRHDGPMWSTIELADGPVTLYEVTRRPVSSSLVVLSSCDSASTAGDDVAALPGFAAALRAMGADTVVATIGELPDDQMTVECVEFLHRRLVAGDGPAAALAHLRAARPDALAAAAFVCWGRP